MGWTLPESPHRRVFLDNDPYYWVINAETMLEQRAWRVRHTDADNVPFGRAMHWSQSITWLMVAAGWLRRLFTGESWPAALENAAIWINPGIRLLLISIGGWMLLRRWGVLPSLLWMGGVAAMGDFTWAFHSLRPDHQSLHVFFSSVSLMLLGWSGVGWTSNARPPEKAHDSWFRSVAPPTLREARLLFLASGVAGGLGLWTGATVQLLALGAACAAALYLVWNMPIQSSQRAYAPELWRTWAAAGAITSFVMYLVEYAGAWPGLRLEVNSPLHAVSWYCAGELLARIARHRLQAGNTPPPYRTWALLALGSLLVPLLIAFGPESLHAMRNVEMKRLHNFIQEFSTFPNFNPASPISRFLAGYGFLPLVIPAAIWLSSEKWSRPYEWALLWMGFAQAAAMGVLAWQQIRWLPFFAAALVWLLAVILAVVARHGRAHRRLAGWIAALMAAQFTYFAIREYRDVSRLARQDGLVIEELAKGFLNRNLAIRLRSENPDLDMRLICEPDLAAPLYHFGRIRSVTSFYWENLAGLTDAVAFFAAKDDAPAIAVARARGLTHVMLPRGDKLASVFTYLRDGQADPGQAHDTLLGRLLRNEPPRWIVPNSRLTFAGHSAYRFGPGQLNSSMTFYDIALPAAP